MDAGRAGGAVVLVHGGFVDGSGWQGVYTLLKQQGYAVSVVQNPTLSLEDDVAVTKRALAAQDGPVVLVGHSYGGAVITEAGTDPKVAALVYIAGFAPDAGELVSTLRRQPAARRPGAAHPAAGRLPVPRPGPVPGGLRGRRESRPGRVHGRRAGPLGRRRPRRDDQRAGVAEQAELYLVATEDRMIPPPAQRAMATRAGATVVEAAGSHAIYVSQPAAVASLIEQAAAARAAAR